MDAPQKYVGWVNSHVGFNPRGQSHSDFLTARLFEDLASMCPEFARAMGTSLEVRLNVGLNGVRQVTRKIAEAEDEDPQELDTNIDGVIIANGSGNWTPKTPGVTSPVALENKTIMTAHGKARKNRYGDMRAFASHVHGQSPATIAAFAIIINTALGYRNPDAFARTAKKTGTNKPDDAVKTIGLFTNGTILRETPSDPLPRVEALLILALDYDGVTPTAKLVPGRPSLAAGSPFSYGPFLERICRLYVERCG